MIWLRKIPTYLHLHIFYILYSDWMKKQAEKLCPQHKQTRFMEHTTHTHTHKFIFHFLIYINCCCCHSVCRAFVRILCVCCPRKIRRKYQPTMRSKSQVRHSQALKCFRLIDWFLFKKKKKTEDKNELMQIDGCKCNLSSIKGHTFIYFRI